MMAPNQDWLEWLLSLNANGAEYVIVGGAAVNAKFAHDIGADGYAGDAGEAVEVAKRLMAR